MKIIFMAMIAVFLLNLPSRADNITPDQALVLASEWGWSKLVKSLLESDNPKLKPSDVNVMVRGKTALNQATRGNNLATIDVLLEHGANVDKKDAEGLTPLMHAVIGDIAYGQSICLGVDLKAQSMPKLLIMGGMFVASAGLMGLGGGFSLNPGQEELGATLLGTGGGIGAGALASVLQPDMTFSRHQTRTIKKLLESGANKETRSTTGMTALLFAAELSLPVKLLALLHNGANLLAANYNGQTAIALAAEEYRMAMARLATAKDAKKRAAILKEAEQGPLMIMKLIKHWSIEKLKELSIEDVELLAGLGLGSTADYYKALRTKLQGPITTGIKSTGVDMPQVIKDLITEYLHAPPPEATVKVIEKTCRLSESQIKIIQEYLGHNLLYNHEKTDD